MMIMRNSPERTCSSHLPDVVEAIEEAKVGTSPLRRRELSKEGLRASACASTAHTSLHGIYIRQAGGTYRGKTAHQETTTEEHALVAGVGSQGGADDDEGVAEEHGESTSEAVGEVGWEQGA